MKLTVKKNFEQGPPPCGAASPGECLGHGFLPGAVRHGTR